MPWYLYLALKQLFPTGRRFPFFTLISVVSVALGVALLVVVLSVMDGFGYEIRQMIVGTEGEVQIRAQGAIENYPALLKKIDAVPGIAASTPTASGALMIEFQKKPAFPAMCGLDLATVEQVVHLSHYLTAGSFDDLDDDSVILSSELARSLGASVGDTVEVYSPLMIERLKTDEVFLPREVRVVGILEIGHPQLDHTTVYCTLRLAQELYGLGTDVHGINVRLQPGVNEDLAAGRLNAVLPSDVRAFSWQDTFSDFLWVVRLEKNIMLFVLMFVILVAAFLTMSLLLVLVFKKTREIGLLGALGAGRREIACCFCLQGVAVGVAGTFSGLVLGFTLLHFRNDFVRAITRLAARNEILARFYQVTELPSHIETGDLAAIVIAALVLSTLAGIVPAVMAARLKPVEALRSE